MARTALRLFGIFITALASACVAPSFELVPSANPDDSTILRPGTEFVSGGAARIRIPEVILTSNEPLPISVRLPAGSTTATASFTLFMSLGKLYAHVPSESIQPLASMPGLVEAIHKALSGKDENLALRSGDRPPARLVLATSLAERLPRAISTAWVDSYNYEPKIKALALVPGMRVRLEAILPITADIDRQRDERSEGSITAPGYLNVLPAWDGGSVSITLSPALEKLGVQSSNSCIYDCKRWVDASGLHNLLGQEVKWRSWSLLYPAINLGPVNHIQGPLQFVHEDLLPRVGVPAVLLVAAPTAKDMSGFIDAAKTKYESQLGTPERRRAVSARLKSLNDALQKAARETARTAKEAKLTTDELWIFMRTGETPRTAEAATALEALTKERRAYDDLRSANEEVAIDCTILSSETSVRCFVLRYRVLPVPEIFVTIQGTQRWVEIGTTVGMVLAPYEPIRMLASFSGAYEEAGDAWLHRQSRLRLDKLNLFRLHMGGQFRVLVRPGPGNPDDAFRQIILQAGDEIKWSS